MERKAKTKLSTLANHKDTDNTVNQSKLAINIYNWREANELRLFLLDEEVARVL